MAVRRTAVKRKVNKRCKAAEKLRPLRPKRIIDISARAPHYEPLVDSNEGNRILFPPTMPWKPRWGPSTIITLAKARAVNLGRNHLSRGDYTCEGYTHWVAFERKATMAELKFDYDSGKLRRQLTNLKRLVRHPYLLLDIPLQQTYGTGKNEGYKYSPEERESNVTPVIMDRVILLCIELGVPWLGPFNARTQGTRIALGEHMMRIMLAHITEKGAKYVPYAEIVRRQGGR